MCYIMVIGLTGPNAAGKGEALNYIKSKGWTAYSLSDILREEAEKKGIAPLRENLIKLGNELRRKNGPSFLAEKAAKKISGKGRYVVDSIRNPAEISELRKIDDFTLIGVDAPVEIRFHRSMARKRPGDAETLKEFIKKEVKENKTKSENQQLKQCLKMADITIINDTSIEDLRRKIDEAVNKIKKA